MASVRNIQGFWLQIGRGHWRLRISTSLHPWHTHACAHEMLDPTHKEHLMVLDLRNVMLNNLPSGSTWVQFPLPAPEPTQQAAAERCCAPSWGSLPLGAWQALISVATDILKTSWRYRFTLGR